jgi:pSer/pThr/pTyr-binding forkhead associated (FHA) protein
VLVDLGSTNFTRVNGERIRRERELQDGDLLAFGRARCRFLAAAPAPPG